MTQPELLDVVELLVDLPDAERQASDQGTIVETYDCAYEVEFANSHGETVALLALKLEQFAVVWQHATKAWTPLADRIVALLQELPEDRQQQVLNFARSLHRAPA
ncbi:DUF4926 domain-containing protein [Leptolyngbya sp. KIOST-1]|uniref:DUF4926 domain-containing protein n=1 Tax=Leptolyngbya sp. KIOST-1 TaxID=1229172 RepID=UPI00055CA113|nr:DUF4926 domain-containing protein [Leptolyngbya sp. KIOST-1]